MAAPKRASLGVLAVIASLSGLATVAAAHGPAAAAVTRQIVRLQGSLDARSDVQPVRELIVVVRGEAKLFYATDWQVYAVDLSQAAAAQPKEPDRVALQGDPKLLERFATARSGQTITILAERRPGAADLFLLALDRCPP